MSNVQVAVRVRPFNDREKAANSQCIITMQGPTTVIRNPALEGAAGLKPFSYDYSYWSIDQSNPENFADQERVFKDLGVTILDNAFAGFNCSIFAYGQTGAGKSYSMLGYGEDKGLIPRVCEDMYKRIDKMQGPDCKVAVEVSYMEIYNENVFDLLNPSSNKSGLKVRNHPTTGPYVEDLSLLAVADYAKIDQLMEEGSKARTVASTNMNATSSRSHAVFTIILTVTKGVGRAMVAKIHMVDLAGSERATATGASGQRLKEGANINKSLSTLGKVIAALAKKSDGKKNTFVPYRDSVLTWLLKESLGGNSKTIMLAAISPADINFEETLSTLRYADSAKQIKNAAIVNEDPTEKLIRELQEEVERLRQLLAEKERESQNAATTAGAQLDGTDGTASPSTAANPDASPSDAKNTTTTASGDAFDKSRSGSSTNLGILDISGTSSIDEIRSQLVQSTKLMETLGKSWETKLRETDALDKERASAFESQGLSVNLVAQNLPNLVNLNEDPLLSGSLVYYLKPGETHVGQLKRQMASTPASSFILLGGLGVASDHCIIMNDGQEVWIHPKPEAATYVNGIRVTSPRRLVHGSRVIIGTNHIFRFNHPVEAATQRRAEEEKSADTTAPMSPRTLSSKSREIDYKFALEERAAAEVDALMANTLHFDLTSDEERQLEKQMKEYYEQKHKEVEEIDKQLEALKKTKDSVLDAIDYEQSRQELVARKMSIDLELEKQKQKFANFSFRVWNEKLERQQLKETITRLVVLIDEANAISKELQKEIHYELHLSSSHPTHAIGEDAFESSFGLFKKIIVEARGIDLRDGRTYDWSHTAFQDLIQDLRSLYSSFLTAPDEEVEKLLGPPPLASKDADVPPEQISPFAIPTQDDALSMFTHIPLRELIYLNHTTIQVPVLDLVGKVCGTLHVELDRITSDSTGSTSAPSDSLAASGSQVEHLVGREIEIVLRINKLSGLELPAPSLFCSYQFWNSSTFKTEIGALANDEEQQQGQATLNFFHEERFVVSNAREDFLTYLENEPLVIELWSVHGTEAVEPPASAKANLEALRKAYSKEVDELDANSGERQEHKEEKYRMLASIMIQEAMSLTAANSDYKNVTTKQEPWNVPSVLFRLRKHIKLPRKVVLQIAQLKDHPISIESCDQVALTLSALPPGANLGVSTPVAPSPVSPELSSSPITAPATPMPGATTVQLKVLAVHGDKVEVEWDPNLTDPVVTPILASYAARLNASSTPRRARGRSSAPTPQLSSSASSIPTTQAPEGAPATPPMQRSSSGSMSGNSDDVPALVGDFEFTLKLNRLSTPVKISKTIGIKFAAVERVRALSRTVSEAQMIEDLNMKEVLKNEEDLLAMSGSHFQVTLLQFRTVAKKVSAMIEEQQFIQRLIASLLLKERLQSELSLIEKLSSLQKLGSLNRSLAHIDPSGDSKSPLPGDDTLAAPALQYPSTKDDVIKRIDAVKQRIVELSTTQTQGHQGQDVTVQVLTADINSRMESKVCGYLAKKAGKIWKQRWCVLSKLYFSVYRTEDDEQPKDILDLTNARINDTSSAQYPNSFAIVNWKNVWFFQAQNADDFKRWMEALDPERALRETQASKEKNLQSKLESMSKALKDATDQAKTTALELAEAHETIGKREDEIIVLTLDLEKLQATVQTLEEHIETLKQRPGTQDETAVEDENEPKTAASGAEDLDELTLQLEESQLQVEDLKLQLEELRNELQDAKEAQTLLEEQVAELEAGGAVSGGRGSSSAEKDEDAKEQMRLLEESAKETETRLKKSEERFATLLETSREEKALLEDQIKDLEQSIRRLEDAQVESSEQGTEAVAAAKAKSAKLENDLVELSAQLEVKDDELRSAQRELARKEKELERVQSQAAISNSAEDDNRAILNEWRAKNAALTEQVSDLETTLQKKDRELARKDKDQAARQEETEALERQVEKLTKELKRVQASSIATPDSSDAQPKSKIASKAALLATEKAEVGELKATIKRLQDALDNKDIEIARLETEHTKKLREATVDLKSTVEMHEYELVQKERDAVKKTKELEAKSLQLKEAEDELERVTEQMHEMKKNMLAKEKTISDKQREIERRDRDIHQMKQSFASLQASFSAATALTDGPQLGSGKTPEEVEKERKESKEAKKETQLAELKEEVEKLSKAASEAKSEAKDRKRQVADLQKELSRREAQLESKDRQLDELTRRADEIATLLADTERNALEAKRSAAAKEREIADLEASVELWRDKVDSIKRAVDDKQRVVEEKESELEDMQNDFDLLTKDTAGLERELTEAARQIQQLDDACFDLQRRLEDTLQELQDARDDDQKNQLVRDHKKQQQQWAQDLADRDADLERSDKIIKQLEKNLDKREKRIIELENQLAASRDKFSLASTSATKEAADLAALKRDNSAKDAQLKRLQDDLDSSQREVRKLQRKIDNAEETPEPSRAAPSSRRRVTREDSDSSGSHKDKTPEAKMEKLREKVEEQNKTIVKLETELTRRTAQIDRLERDRASQKTLLTELESSIQSSSRRNGVESPSVSSSRRSESARQLDELQEQLHEAQKQIKKMERAHKTELADKNNKLEQLQRRVEFAQRDAESVIRSRPAAPAVEAEPKVVIEYKNSPDTERELEQLRDKVIELQDKLREKLTELDDLQFSSKRSGNQVRRAEERFDSERTVLQDRVNALEQEVAKLRALQSSRNGTTTNGTSSDVDSTPIDWKLRCQQTERELEALRREVRSGKESKLPRYTDLHTKVLIGEVETLKETTGAKTRKIQELRGKQTELQSDYVVLKGETMDLQREKDNAAKAAGAASRQATRLQEQVDQLTTRLEEITRSEKSLRKYNDELLNERVTLVLAVRKAQIEVLAATGERLQVTLPASLDTST